MSNFPDMVTQFGGMPLGGGRYEAMWGNRVWFVDYDNGSSGNYGDKPGAAFKYFDTAISRSGHNDVIYIRPRSPELGAAGVGPYYGGDPGDILPESTTNWTIPWTSYGLSVIGTGSGVGQARASVTNLQGASGATTSVLSLNAPFCSIENIGVKTGSSTTALIKQKMANDSVTQAFHNSYYNVWFRNTGNAPGLIIDSGSYDVVDNCTFSRCHYGVIYQSYNAVPNAQVLSNCYFDNTAAGSYDDVSSTGGMTRALITGCNFNHAEPSGGGHSKYIYMATTSTGLISSCYTGSSDATVATNFTLNGLTYANCWALESFMVAA